MQAACPICPGIHEVSLMLYLEPVVVRHGDLYVTLSQFVNVDPPVPALRYRRGHSGAYKAVDIKSATGAMIFKIFVSPMLLGYCCS